MNRYHQRRAALIGSAIAVRHRPFACARPATILSRHVAGVAPGAVFLLLVSFGIPAIAQSGGGYDLSWSTVDGGGGTSTGGNYELSGTIGQPDAGSPASPMSGGNYELVGGFWAGITSPACTVFAPADFDQDCDVDQDDVDAFLACVSGPDLAYLSGCEDKDFDLDGDVDQTDFAKVQKCITGSNIVADPNCAD
jgi:hypothetical protein